MAQSRFLDKFLFWFANTTDAPVDFGKLAGLTVLSTIALGRRWVDYTSPLHANIFGMIVGDSGVARKGTAVARALAMVKDIEPGRVGPNDFTSESLFLWMQKNKDENTKKGRQRITIFADEFGADLARMAAYASTMKADFCRLYDCVEINKIRMSGSIEIPNPRVSFLAACAYQMMIGGLNHNDWATGYLMRFLYVAPINMRVKFSSQPDPRPDLQNEALTALVNVRDQIYNAKGGMRVSPAAKQIYEQSQSYHEYHMQGSNEVVRTYAGRFWTNVSKLALLYQLDEDPSSSTISADAMRNACEFAAEICWPSFLLTFEKTALTTFTNLILVVNTILIEAGGKGVWRSILAQRFLGRRELIDVINWLKLNRLVKWTVVQRMSGGADELLMWDGPLPQ